MSLRCRSSGAYPAFDRSFYNEDRRSEARSPSLPNRTGGFPASGFLVSSSPCDGRLRLSNQGHWKWFARELLAHSDSRSRFRWVFPMPECLALSGTLSGCLMSRDALVTLPSYVPWLHGRYPLLRYYGRSDPGELLYGRSPWFPDSRHSNFRPSSLQSSVVLHQTRSTPSALAALFCSGFATMLQARQNHRPYRVHLAHLPRRALLQAGRSLSVALHPGVSPRCSYFPLLALQCRPGQGLSPCCSSALSGAQHGTPPGFFAKAAIPGKIADAHL